MDQGLNEFPGRTGNDNWVVYSVRSPGFLRLFEKHQECAGRYATKLMFSHQLLNKINEISSADQYSDILTDNAATVYPTLSTEPELAVTVKTTGEIFRNKYNDKEEVLKFSAEDIPFSSLPVQTRTFASRSSLARLFSVILKPRDLLFVMRDGSVPESSVFVDLSQRSSSIRVIFHVRLDLNVPFERSSRDYLKIRQRDRALSDEMFGVRDSRFWRITPTYSAFSRTERNSEVTAVEVDAPTRNAIDEQTEAQTSTQANQSTGPLNGSAKKRKRDWSKILQDELDQGACSSDSNPEEVEEALKETQPIFSKKPLLVKHVALEIKIAPVSAPLTDSDAEHSSQLTSSEEFFSAKTAVSSEEFNSPSTGISCQKDNEEDLSQRIF